MHRLAMIVSAFAFAACGKPAPTAPAPPTTAAAATAAAPEPAQTPDAVVAPATLELEERRGELVVTKDNTYFRVPFSARIPKGWVPIGPPGLPVLDGSEGTAVFGASADSRRDPEIAFMASICADCAAEKVHADQEGLARRGGGKVLRSELTGPGRAILVYEKDKEMEGEGVRTAIASLTVGGGSPAVLQCVVGGPPSATWDALLQACLSMTVGELRPLLDGELLAAEEAKLAGCPGKSAVNYGGNSRATSFDAVKTAGAVLLGPGRVSVRLANVGEAVLTGDEVMKGTLRLDLDLTAAPGKEVTSGTYAGETKAPPLLEATMMGAPAPGDAPTAPDDCASWVECTPSAGWSGPNQKVEVIARTRARICGRFHLEDAGHRVSGEFDVPIALDGAATPE